MDTGWRYAPYQFLLFSNDRDAGGLRGNRDIELLIIDKDTTIRGFRKELRDNEVYYVE